ncbi:MAG: alpha/beta fold hydrolase [Actinomycetes bacterium]
MADGTGGAPSTPVVGTGDHKVICLHGWFGSSAGWGWLPEVLDRERFSYAFPDYRGYGTRRGEPGEYTMSEIAEDTVALADSLGWDRFSLVGHSMGGMAVQRVLVTAPGRVRKLVGVGAVPASGVPFDERGWALFSGAADDVEKRRMIVAMTTGGRLSPVWVNQVVRHSLDVADRTAFAAYLEAWANTDFAAEVKGSPVPVLVVAGEHDPALGAPVMEETWMRWYPHATLEVMPNAGHYPMFETPVSLATTVEGFLAT